MAVKDIDASMTYRELNLRSDLVARDLTQRGLQVEEPVAILFPASCEYVVAMLGVLKAGGSYLPIDPDGPVKRIEFLLQDGGIRILLTNAEGIKEMQGWPGTALELASIIAKSDVAAGEAPRITFDPKRRAYIIYTSGSTGQPKGVEIEHHSLTNLVCAYREQLHLTAQDHTTMFANVAFDVSVADVWPALCTGGRLVIPPRTLFQYPDGLIAWLVKEEITWTFVPTGMAEILFARAWPARMPLRFMMAAGDRLRVRPPKNLPFTVLNGYGPTENTVISTWSIVKAQDGSSPLPPTGRAVSNVKAYVLDENRQPAGEGVEGELSASGREQLTRRFRTSVETRSWR